MQTSTQKQQALRLAVTDWIAGIKQQFNVDETAIGKKSGVAASTIYRWQDDEGSIVPTNSSLMKIASAFDIALPNFGAQEPAAARRGFGESDVRPFEGAPPAELKPENVNQSIWRVDSRALELAGYLPGDLVVMDQAQLPIAGDIVVAQVYNFERGTAETRLRVYDGSFISVRTMDPAILEAPVIVDDRQGRIMGPIVKMLRTRPPRAA